MLNALDEKSVKQSLKDLRDNHELEEMKNAALGRSRADWLIGMNLSRAYTIRARQAGYEGVSVGRVMTTTMAFHSKAWNDKKISAHHAIIPTRIKVNFENLNAVEQNLYVMVAQAYLAQFYPVHEYKATTVTISFADEKFVGKGKLVTKLGWKAIYKNAAKSESEEEESVLPPVKENESIKYVSGKVTDKTIQPPTRFNPSTLL